MELNSSPIKIWIEAFRLRTLPLALAGVGMGNLLALVKGHFRPQIFFLTVLTALALQILSNLSNDYGDSVHGADHSGRTGPKRAVQSGAISRKSMKLGMAIFGTIAFILGVILLWVSFENNPAKAFPLFLVGLLSLAAAYFYTNGSRPYGYMALGDVSVFLFFGMVAVFGGHYLHNQVISPYPLLPSLALGLWSTAVLNANNMRDMESDQAAGKFTIPLWLGLRKAKIYHSILVIVGGVCLFVFSLNQREPLLLSFGIGFFIMLKALVGVWKSKTVESLDTFLKPQAIGTFLAVAIPFLLFLISK